MMTTDGDDQGLPPRTGKGRFTKTLEGAERDAEACRLYTYEGRTYQQVSDILGYGGKQNAHRAIQRMLLDTIQQPADELRAREVLRAEEIYLMARDIARDDHYAHSGGKLVYGPPDSGGQPLLDPAPRLSAMDRMLKAMERLAKLKGLDSATKVHNLTLEEIQKMIADEEAELARMEAEGGGEGG
jgi:hypothetical protein